MRDGRMEAESTGTVNVAKKMTGGWRKKRGRGGIEWRQIEHKRWKSDKERWREDEEKQWGRIYTDTISALQTLQSDVHIRSRPRATKRLLGVIEGPEGNGIKKRKIFRVYRGEDEWKVEWQREGGENDKQVKVKIYFRQKRIREGGLRSSSEVDEHQ